MVKFEVEFEVGFEFGLELGLEFKFKCRAESAVRPEAEFQISILCGRLLIEFVTDVAVVGEASKIAEALRVLSELLLVLLVFQLGWVLLLLLKL